MTILDACRDPVLFGPWFDAASWRNWLVFLAVLFGLSDQLDDDEVRIAHEFTKRNSWGQLIREGWVIVGRRGGKSRIAALVAVYLACFKSYDDVLAPGEVGTLAIVAADRRQSRTILRYINGFLDAVPMLRKMVESRTRDTITLSNRVCIEVHTSNFRAVRGYTLIAAICDEIAFWRDESSANPDTEILAGLRPGMATVPGALLLCISSPYSRRGALFEAWRRHFGRDDSQVLVWQADTRAMNPLVDKQVIADAYDLDEIAALAEYGAQFRRDLEDFVSKEALDAVTVPGRTELPYCEGARYFAALDPAGGSGADSMTLAIGHHFRGLGILDHVDEVRPPFDPRATVERFASTLKRYGVTRVTGDRWGGEFVRAPFREKGIAYELADRAKSDFYRDFLPLVTSRRVELLDHRKMVAQFASLERRVTRAGKDSIDHMPGGHDDVANCVAMVLVAAAKRETARGVAQLHWGG